MRKEDRNIQNGIENHHQRETIMSDIIHNLSGISIYDIYGADRIPLNGDYSINVILDTLINEWIPLYECHKCGRSDYCKFAEKISESSHRMLDIQCGVVVSAMTNFLENTYHLLDGMDLNQKQNYFDGAYFLSQFIFNVEQAIGSSMSEVYMKYLGLEYAPRFFGRITNLRDSLNSLGSLFQSIPEMFSQRAILFVEGKSEKAFIEKLKESHMLWFMYIVIEDYEGKGNRHLKRIQMLLEKYIDLGYVIYIQGDADGNHTDIFKAMADRDLVKTDHTYVFEHDFESSIPPEILLSALNSLGKLENVSIDEFIDKVGGENRSVIGLLREHFNVDVEPLKIDLAVIVADIINNDLYPWWNNEEFLQTELGKFLDFLRHVY